MNKYLFNFVEYSLNTSVADPDPVFLGHPEPDPGKYRIRENTGSGSFIHKKTPGILIFSLHKIV